MPADEGPGGPPAPEPDAPARPRDHRSLGRDLALRAVFARDVGLSRPQEVLEYLCREEDADAEAAAFARELVAGVGAHIAEVDRRIAAYARRWSLPRLAAVDRNILRLAVFELGHRSDVPPSVVIDEAVGLADVYGGEESARFVNGLLGQLARDMQAGQPMD